MATLLHECLLFKSERFYFGKHLHSSIFFTSKIFTLSCQPNIWHSCVKEAILWSWAGWHMCDIPRFHFRFSALGSITNNYACLNCANCCLNWVSRKGSLGTKKKIRASQENKTKKYCYKTLPFYCTHILFILFTYWTSGSLK